jgi:hypothetical protein
MVSTEGDNAEPATGNRSVLDVLKHIEAGPTRNGGVYVGARFSY